MGTNKIPNKDNWQIVTSGVDNILKDKKRLIFYHIMNMMNKCQRIFEYKNLPEELPAREIEKYTQTYGFTIWKKVDGKMYVFFGGLGGIPNVYYLPTLAIVVNPFLKYNAQLEIDEDCVVMWNDSMHVGLSPLHEKYASLLAEAEISLRIATINARIPALLTANSDTDKAEMETYLGKVENGELAVCGTDDFISKVTGGDSTRAFDYNNRATTHIKEIIEEHQYLSAKWWNELGINANFNMKREAINESEASMNEDALLPLLDDMLEQRKLALDKINKMFGLNIEVEFSSSWYKLRKDIKTAQKVEESEIKENEKSPEEKKPEDTPKEKEGEE